MLELKSFLCREHLYDSGVRGYYPVEDTSTTPCRRVITLQGIDEDWKADVSLTYGRFGSKKTTIKKKNEF